MGCDHSKSLAIREAEEQDFYAIELQDEQENWMALSELNADDVRMLVNMGSTTVTDFEGRIILIGGLIEVAPGRAEAWTIISEHAGVHMVRLSRMVKRYLDGGPFRRIEANVRSDFAPGIRWANMMGFEMEGLMKQYSPNGADHYLYARVR